MNVMHGPSVNRTGPRLPPDFRGIPVHPADENIPIRLCVLVRTTPDPVAGYFFQLRDLPGARVYLGCLSDVGGNIREWIEIWVQTIEGFNPGGLAPAEAISNHSLDQRWITQYQAIRAWTPQSVVETSWETQHPLPSLIDLDNGMMVQPKTDPDGGLWKLCQNDALLAEAGLPPYSTSLVRYLYQPEAGKDSKFVPVAGPAVENAATLPANQALGLKAHLVPFNLPAGFMMAVSFHPFTYTEYLNLLGGKPWDGLADGKSQFQLGGVYRNLTDSNQNQNSSANLFLGAHGRKGRLLETLYLKLRLLTEAVSATRACVQAHQLPFLNLSPESFRVRLGEIGEGLPCFWTAQCTLVKPSQAFAIQVATAENHLFAPVGPSPTSVYLPGGQIAVVSGSGPVRIRQVYPQEPDSLILEGTLVMQEPARCSPRDILWMRLALSRGFLDLYGHLDRESLAFSEVRFRSIPQPFPAPIAQALSSGTMVVFPGCQYHILPCVSSPGDLYSLGVLAIRTLLVSDTGGLPVALDELFSLARQVALEYKADSPLPQRIAAIFQQKTDWLRSLGPHHLHTDSFRPEEAISIVPIELWCEVLAVILRFFPGAGPDSYCRDLGDAPPLALERVFDHPLAELQNLLLKTRSLITIDWTFNREIRTVIEEFRNP